jgi:Flp pilus assembly protein TadB
MVFKTASFLAIAMIILAVFLFVFFLGFLIRVALFVLIVLGVIWLWKELTPRKRKR